MTKEDRELMQADNLKRDQQAITDFLATLKTFGPEPDGSYSDRCNYVIKKGFNGKRWEFHIMSEVSGVTWRVKELNHISDLRRLYMAITDIALD